MRILFVRHGDPDYTRDDLTENGIREAEALAKTMKDLRIDDVFVSPMGRAMRTASFSIAALSNGWIGPEETFASLRDRRNDILPGQRVEVLDYILEFLTLLNINGDQELMRAFPNTRHMTAPPDPDKLTLSSRFRPSDYDQFMPNSDGNLPVYAPRIAWDIIPSYYAEHPELAGCKEWRQSHIAKVNDLPFSMTLLRKSSMNCWTNMDITMKA